MTDSTLRLHGVQHINNMSDLVAYFSVVLDWDIEVDDFFDIDDVSYDFDATDIGLKEEAFAKILSLRQLQPIVDNQKWGIFCIEFDSKRFEVSALRKILSGLVPKRRNAANHAVWEQKDLLFLCLWGSEDTKTIGIAHFEDAEHGLPRIKMISCAPAVEDFTQIKIFESKISKLAWPQDDSDISAWHDAWSSAFTTTYRQNIQDASTLTARLASEAQNIRDTILSILDVESPNGYVHLLFDKFKQTLIHDMAPTQFADMYAQTVVYGLFSARCMDSTPEGFSAAEAIDCIPNTNPFLKSLMKECLGAENNTRLSFDELEIGNVTDLLLHSNTEAIIQDFNRQTGGGREDPVIHFYEEFLTEYDKTQKVQRGVYYTPQPVVNFIVRAVDDILKDKFSLDDGLASTETRRIRTTRPSKKLIGGLRKMVDTTIDVPLVQVLDPATGTGTFIRQTILQIYSDFCSSNKDMAHSELNEAWNAYVSDHLLPRLNAFELMMAPYAVAHMKLAMVLKDTGYDFDTDKRLQLYLTNSLEEPGSDSIQLSLFDDPLAAESIAANAAKKNNAINIVLGNPPYSCESCNKGDWITNLMETYKFEPGLPERLKERNSKPLNDDYVKFIRYAQHILDISKQGIVAYVNPHGFLDGPIFRGMRYSLLRDFSEIYILDLHGNANRGEVCPNGETDENVFDIKQGVCIIILVKRGSEGKTNIANVYRSDLWGSREEKYAQLSALSLSSIKWDRLTPCSPQYLFCREDHSLKEQYENGIHIKDLFPINGTGVLTKRDKLCIHFERDEALQSALDLAHKPKDFVAEKYSIRQDVRDWKYQWAKEDVLNSTLSMDMVEAISYRPFDTRYAYYTGQSRGFMGWPVHAIMQHMLIPHNIALVTARSNKSNDSSHFFVSDMMVEYKCGERTTNSSVFPLYVKQDGILTSQVNLDSEIIDRIAKRMELSYNPQEGDGGASFGPLDLFGYIYAYLYSEAYRQKYRDFINRDFPIIPYPASGEQFYILSNYGKELIKTHLLQFEIGEATHAFKGENRNISIQKLNDGRAFINSDSYFEDVDAELWNFTIGGYQPCQRWLKERKGRALTNSDLVHYRKILVALERTKESMRLIDKIVGTA